jgi:hypothetical protein
MPCVAITSESKREAVSVGVVDVFQNHLTTKRVHDESIAFNVATYPPPSPFFSGLIRTCLQLESMTPTQTRSLLMDAIESYRKTLITTNIAFFGLVYIDLSVGC